MCYTVTLVNIGIFLIEYIYIYIYFNMDFELTTSLCQHHDS